MTAKVVLIGDSIRLGYQETVRRELTGLAEVWAPEENGETSRNVLAHLPEWVLSQGPTMVHLNCGLHDVKRAPDTNALLVPLEEYRANVRQLLEQVRQGTPATVIWATTTPVNEAWHQAQKSFARFNADIRAYNAAAVAIAQALGLPVDDLFTVVMDAGRDRYLSADGVHFTDEGYELLGKVVADVIKKALP